MIEPAKFWSKVDKSGSCWEWVAYRTVDGYGRYRSVLAHRVSYEAARGPIPEGLTIDHLCRNRRCVNPDHMEAVPQGVNTLRGSSPSAINARRVACINGHPYTPENTYLKPDGGRDCRACIRIRVSAYRSRRRDA